MSDESQMRVLRRLPRWWPLLAVVALLGLSGMVVALVPHWRTRARLREIGELSQRTDAGAVRRLLVLMTDRNGDVSTSAVAALACMKNPRVVQSLIVALGDTDARLRRGAACGLGNMNDPRAVGPLIAALKDTDAGVQRCAVWALVEIKDPRAVEPLIAALKDTDAGVRAWAAWALAAMTGVDCGEDVEKWQKWWDENKDRYAKPEGRSQNDESTTKPE